uniref:Transcription-repair-coupling factor n=1 Tax=Lygus hesperus TaxID=30085 RepID=A0A0A9WS27_LYGHE
MPTPSDGYDKSMHIKHFVNVQHAWLTEQRHASHNFDVMQQSMTISTYELDRSFPSTTSAIEVETINKVNLNPYETAEEVISNRYDEIFHLSKSKQLIIALKDALIVRGLPPGVYMKEVIKAMKN